MGRTDIYVTREKWKDGYHVVARSEGRFVASRKWKSAEDTKKMSDRIWKDNITKDPNVHAFLFQAPTNTGEYRSMKVFSRKRVFIGNKSSRKLDTGPMRKYAKDTKYCHSEIESQKGIEWEKMRVKSIYHFGVKVHGH